MGRTKLGWPWRWLAKAGGGVDLDGMMSCDMLLIFFKQQPLLKAAIEQMIAWDPKRIILAHGCCYERNDSLELKRALRRLVD